MTNESGQSIALPCPKCGRIIRTKVRNYPIKIVCSSCGAKGEIKSDVKKGKHKNDQTPMVRKNIDQQYDEPRYSTNAIISLIIGILGWTFFIWMPGIGIMAALFGHYAEKEIKNNPSLKGKEIATLGGWLGGIRIILIEIIILIMIGIIIF